MFKVMGHSTKNQKRDADVVFFHGHQGILICNGGVTMSNDKQSEQRNHKSMLTEEHRQRREQDRKYEGRGKYFTDVDRMVNEGLGGGEVTAENGHIGRSMTDEIKKERNDNPNR
jgi:hypothetical protein